MQFTKTMLALAAGTCLTLGCDSADNDVERGEDTLSTADPIRSFDAVLEDLNFELTDSERETLDSGEAVIGLIPKEHLPVKHPNGTIEADAETFEKLKDGTLDYRLDPLAWAEAGLFDPSKHGQVVSAIEAGINVEQGTNSFAKTPVCVPEGKGIKCEPEPDPCHIELAVVVKNENTPNQGPTNTPDVCGGKSLNEYEFISGDGAYLNVVSNGGVMNWLSRCKADQSGLGTSTLTATLVNVDGDQDFSCLAGHKIHAGVLVDANLEAELRAKTENSVTQLTADVVLPHWDWWQVAYSKLTVGGNHLDQQKDISAIELAYECGTSTSIGGSIGANGPGVTVSHTKVCGGDALFEEENEPATVASSGTGTLVWPGPTGIPTDGDEKIYGSITRVWGQSNFKTEASSTWCTSGDGFGRCTSMLGEARATTTKICLKVESDNSCEVVPANADITCSVSGAATLGQCG